MHCTSASQLPPFRITLVQQTAAIINDRHEEWQNAPGRRLRTLLFQRMKIYFIKPDTMFVNSENIPAEYIGGNS